jgi:carboxypeptidase D
VYNQAFQDWQRPGGCRDKIINCRTKASQLDPEDYGNNAEVNAACIDANDFCGNNIENIFNNANRGYYDIAHPSADTFPPPWFLGYLSQNWIQGALGVPVNYTESVSSVYNAFGSTGDYPRGGFLEDLTYILESGIKVALVYGDRDFACNWLGGEDVSLAIKYKHSEEFRTAGYADLRVNDTYVGGKTRQYGNLSFTRVFEAGHEVPAYQPETAWQIFQRALFNRDIATGTEQLCDETRTSGPSDTFNITNVAPPFPDPTCYILSPGTCDQDTYASVQNGTALVENYVVQEQAIGNATGNATGTGTN